MVRPCLSNSLRRSVFALAIACLHSTLILSQTTSQPSSVDDLKKRADIANAEKDAITAELSRDAAKKAQQDALTPDPIKAANDAKVAAANAQKAVTDAQTSAANASKAKADADAAALQSQIGTVPSSGYTGAVDLKDKAGSTEAALLAARAINTTTAKIVARTAFLSGVKQKEVWVFALGDLPNFNSLIMYQSYSSAVNKAFDDADRAAQEKMVPFGIRYSAARFAPAAIGLGLDAANKLLSFFKTDYAVGGVDVTYDDAALVHSIAGRLLNSFNYLEIANGKKSNVSVNPNVKSVMIPSLFNEASLSGGGQVIFDQFTDWSKRSNQTQAHIIDLTEQGKDFSDAASREPDAAKKAQLTAQAKACADAVDALSKGLGVYNAIVTKLTTADDKGSVPIVATIREKTIFDLLNSNDSGVVLLVKVQKAGGAYYTKKNMWTIFGGMPIYHMGGVALSFVLIGPKGSILDSGLVPVDGGFIKASKLPAALDDQ